MAGMVKWQLVGDQKARVLLLGVILLVVIMAFTGILNYMTFTDNYNRSLVNTYSVAGNELVKKIEYAVRYGKPIDNFYGMNDTLKELKAVIKEVEQVNIISTKGEVIYNLDGFVRDERLPEELLKAAFFQQGAITDSLSFLLYKDKGYIFSKITDNRSEHVASLAMVFPGDAFLQFNSGYTKKLFVYLAGVAFLSLFLLYIIFYKTKFIIQNKAINKKRLLLALLLLMSSVQLLYGGINYFIFKNAYINMSLKSKDFIQDTVANNIEGIYQKGISLQNIRGIEEYFQSIRYRLPQIAAINVSEVSLNAASVSEAREYPSSEGVLVINYNNPEQSCEVTASISNSYINQVMFKILLDMLTVLVISIFFMIELTLLAVIVMGRQRKQSKAAAHDIDIKTSHGLVRALIFLINICVFMSITFVPLVMHKLYQPIAGLPRDVVLGLPLSAEMLGGIMAIVLAGWSIDKKGWRAIFYTGALFLAVGNLLSGISFSAVPFIFSRVIAGLGIGFIMMALRSLVVSLPERNIAIAEFAAGAVAGLNCGAVIGGMLSDRIGYTLVFYVAASAVALLFIYVSRLMTGFEIEERKTRDISEWRKFVNFVADKRAIIFLLCIFIPYFISGAFLDYYFPLFASANALSQSDISRAFLLNGLCIIYLGPLLTGFAVKKLGNINSLQLSLFIVVCGLATFMGFETVAAAFVTIILLGIAESFGVSMQTSYFLNLKGIKEMEINKGIAYFSAMVNISRMAGPMVFGIALSLGMRMGVGIIAVTLFVLLMAFIVLAKIRPGCVNT